MCLINVHSCSEIKCLTASAVQHDFTLRICVRHRREYLAEYHSAQPPVVDCLSLKPQHQPMDPTVSQFLDLSAGIHYLNLFIIRPCYLSNSAVNIAVPSRHVSALS